MSSISRPVLVTRLPGVHHGNGFCQVTAQIILSTNCRRHRHPDDVDLRRPFRSVSSRC